MIENAATPSTALYVHIPFCARRCHYCDFTVHRWSPTTDIAEAEALQDAYVTALLAEARLVKEATEVVPLQTFFWGGGTPTLLSPRQLERLGEGLLTLFPLATEVAVEWTVEANPETLLGPKGKQRLGILRQLGVNRLSLGVQTLSPALLPLLGRQHTPDDVARSVGNLQEAGFTNFSFDLIFGLPQQKLCDWKETLQKAVMLQPTHLSCYHLTVEKGTRFASWQREGNLPLPTEDMVYTMYQLARSELPVHGYDQYEVSNFSRPGYACQHNLGCWQNHSYYGLGLGACGYVRRRRQKNVTSLPLYLRRVAAGERPLQVEEEETAAVTMENFFLLGLRCLAGVKATDFRNRYHQEPQVVFPGVLERLVREGWLVEKADGWSLTEKGLLQGNRVFASFLREQPGC